MQARAERTNAARAVLLVVGDAALEKRIVAQLRALGHETTAADGLEGARRSLREPHALLVIDASLGEGALMLCTAIGKQTPVVVLTEPGDATTRIAALERGAADCVATSSAREIALHVGAILRRSKKRTRPEPKDRFGSVEFDREAHRVWIDEEEISLTVSELRLLAHLYDQRPRVVDRRALLRALGRPDDVDATRALDTMVKRLRRKLGTEGAAIRTVRAIGYRLAAADEMTREP
jgi:two-component system phosphate regulon response regulator PhoB